MIYLHIGAGPADLDQRTNGRCGFTEYIKKNYKRGDKIFLVEANPLHIPKLKKTYKHYDNVKIFNLGISNSSHSYIEFYYSHDDKPHYPTCSLKYEHVKKHYPNSKISKFRVKTMSINKFLKKYINEDIDYCCIDIEGMEYEVLNSIDYKKQIIKNISFEFVHLTKIQKRELNKNLTNNGYSYCGFGYDHENLDLLFKKKIILTNRLLSKIFWIIGRKHRKFFNLFIFKN